MNEYLDAFEELQDKDTFRGQQWFGERQKLVEKYSWAVPGEDAIIYLAEFKRLIEIGAGNGYWAKCIEDAGGMVEAFDMDVPDKTWTTVHEEMAHDIDVENKPVLMVWPPHGEQMAAGVARRNPSHILYVGEPRGGCTASDDFFDELSNRYGLVAKVDIPSYVGINDDLFHYVRKT